MKRAALRLPVTLSALLVSLIGCGDSGSGGITKLIGLNMNEVATKVAELPQRYTGLFSRGLDFSPDGRHLAVMSETVDDDHQNIHVTIGL